MLVRHRLPLSLCVALLGLTACDTDDGRQLPAPGPDQTRTIVTTTTLAATDALPGEGGAVEGGASAVASTEPMVVTVPWSPGAPIPIDNTCEGADRSPAISWGELPDGTVEVAIAVTDLTAEEFVHWVAFGLDPASGGVAENAAASLVSQAINGFGKATYGGPCPPSGTHTYRFTVYALGQQLETPSGVSAEETLQAIGAATLQSASTTGTYTAT